MLALRISLGLAIVPSNPELNKMPSTTIYGPMRNKYKGKCLMCKGPLDINDMIYWSKVRPTAEQYTAIKSGNMKPLDKITLHTYCFETWERRFEFEVMAYRGISASDLKSTYQSEPIKEKENTPMPPMPIDEASTAPSTQSNDLFSVIANGILPLVEARLKNSLDTSQVIDIVNDIVNDKVKEALKDHVQRIEVTVTKDEVVTTMDMGMQHKQFPTLLKAIGAKHNGNRLNVWVAGGAGSGKSKASEFASQALGLQFRAIGSINEAHEIFGYVSPIDGKYYGTGFREVIENGGVFCFDDFDGSDPVCCVKLLGALGNSVISFPDAMVTRHKDACIILTANTWGHGATSEYVGRMKQDAALLDRFVKIQWETDEALELATCSDMAWVKRVQSVRRQVKAKGLKVLVTPRASYHGAALIAAGFTHEETEVMVLANGMSKDQWEMVR